MKFAFANTSNIDEADAVIQGVPSQAGSLFGSPASAPEYIRQASHRIYGSIYGNIWNSRVVDAGNMDVEGDAWSVAKQVSEQLIESPFTVVLGGDHSITYGIIDRLRKPLVVFDAHPDCFPSSFNHSSFIKYLIDNNVSGKNDIVIIGLSNPSKPEMNFMNEMGIEYVWSKDVEKSMKSPFDDFHLSIDIDCLYLQPGSYQPELLGIMPYTLLELMFKWRDNFSSMDVVEVNPSSDVSMVSALTAARIIIEAIAMKSRS